MNTTPFILDYTKSFGKLLINVKVADELWEITSINGEKRKMLFDVSIIKHAELEGTVFSIVLPFVSFNFRSFK